MQYNDLTFTIAARHGAGYHVSAVAWRLGRVSQVLEPPDATWHARIALVEALGPRGESDSHLRAAGEALFRWLTSGPLENQLRLAWDRADQQGRGLRLRLSIDAPEVAAWPWELLYDPARDHAFGASASTLLLRYLDRTDQFGALAQQEATLPLDLLLVIPDAPDLNLKRERAMIEDATVSLRGLLRLHVLDDKVTLTALADTLLSGKYAIVQFSGHGGFRDGQGYLALNRSGSGTDLVDGGQFSRFMTSYRSVKLVILNGCNTGQVDDVRAFQGLAPQLVRRGIPAVVAMQYAVLDEVAIAFAREFYRQLCVGANAGHVDAALAHSRAMLGVLYPGQRSFAAPVLYTHAAKGIIYRLPKLPAGAAQGAPLSAEARLEAFHDSLRLSEGFDEDWALADRARLQSWHQVLKQAEESYRQHLTLRRRDIREAAQRGLVLVQGRMEALERAMRSAP